MDDSDADPRTAGAAHLPFGLEEFRARRDRVRAEMERRGLDLLYVTSPANLFYLTGYEGVWYPSRLPVGAALDRHSGTLLAFDWTRHEAYVRSRVLCDDAVFFAYGEAASTVARGFAERGWSNRTIGIEWSSPNPAAPVMTGVTEALRQAGAKTVPGDWVVDQVRLYKSAAELDRIRRAAAIADDAFRQLQRDLRPGMTELEVSAHLALLLAQRSSGIAATPPLIHSGPEAWRDIHSFPSNRRIETGDIISIDCCGVVDRYHANLGRTFSLGPPSERACRMVELAAGSLGELQSVARLGEGPETAATAADRYVRERLPAENVWWIGGYALGIGFPPSWVGHTYLANDGLERCLLLPGYVSNFENVLVDAEDGFEAGCIDTIVMTESGIELLSAIPREILVAGS